MTYTEINISYLLTDEDLALLDATVASTNAYITSVGGTRRMTRIDELCFSGYKGIVDRRATAREQAEAQTPREY